MGILTNISSSLARAEKIIPKIHVLMRCLATPHGIFFFFIKKNLTVTTMKFMKYLTATAK
jgi:hypothetical protein